MKGDPWIACKPFMPPYVSPTCALFFPIPPPFTTPPAPQIDEEIPTNWRNKSADRFFSKTGSQCPGCQSQAPNTPSFWLLCGWSHVETQNISQFSKKNSSLVSTWSLSRCMSVSGSGPVVYALVFKIIGSGRTDFFCTFCHLSRGEKWFSLHKQSLPEEDECTGFPFLSDRVLGGCAADPVALICNQSCPAVVNLTGPCGRPCGSSRRLCNRR